MTYFYAKLLNRTGCVLDSYESRDFEKVRRRAQGWTEYIEEGDSIVLGSTIKEI